MAQCDTAQSLPTSRAGTRQLHSKMYSTRSPKCPQQHTCNTTVHKSQHRLSWGLALLVVELLLLAAHHEIAISHPSPSPFVSISPSRINCRRRAVARAVTHSHARVAMWSASCRKAHIIEHATQPPFAERPLLGLENGRCDGLRSTTTPTTQRIQTQL